MDGMNLDTMSDQELLALYQQEKARVTGKPPKVLSSPLQTQETGDIEAIQAASGISGTLGRVGSQLDTNQLDLGPIKNLTSKARNFMGMSSPQSRNFASFQATLEKIRNDSLRLNKGTQTEGDAVRAWNELFTNLNDEALVKQRLGEIDAINQRAILNKKNVVQQRRQAQGVLPADLTKVDEGAQYNPYDLSKGQSRQIIPVGSFYKDAQGNIRRNDNVDAGNPIVVPAKKTPVGKPAVKGAPKDLKAKYGLED